MNPNVRQRELSSSDKAEESCWSITLNNIFIISFDNKIFNKIFAVMRHTFNKDFFLVTMDTNTSNFLLIDVGVINHFTVVIEINSDCVVQRLDWLFRRCRPSFRVQVQKLDFVPFGENDVVFDAYARFPVIREFARRAETFTSVDVN